MYRDGQFEHVRRNQDMREAILSIVLAVLTFGSPSAQAAQTGSIVAWGSNEYGQCNVPDPNSYFTTISAGWDHNLGLKGCLYELIGDINNDCRFDLLDFALMAANWLIDCVADPFNPACVPVQ